MRGESQENEHPSGAMKFELRSRSHPLRGIAYKVGRTGRMGLSRRHGILQSMHKPIKDCSQKHLAAFSEQADSTLNGNARMSAVGPPRQQWFDVDLGFCISANGWFVRRE